jgi:hypothetical protein
LCPCGWGFRAFSPRVPVIFLREKYARNVTPSRVLVDADYLFSSLSEGARIPAL